MGHLADFGSGHDLIVGEFEPHVGLWAEGPEPGACLVFWVSLSFCSSPVHALSKINIKKRKERKRQEKTRQDKTRQEKKKEKKRKEKKIRHSKFVSFFFECQEKQVMFFNYLFP